MDQFIRPGSMLGRLVLVAGIVGASSLKFSNYQFGGQNYLKVEVDDGSLECPKTGKLAAQYNLGSVLIPGVSPLAYRAKNENDKKSPYVWNDPATSTSALPKWWRQNQDQGRAQYRLRSETDSILATGLFIPEMELDGEYWSTTNYKNESRETNKNRGDRYAKTRPCIAGKRPTEADIKDGVYAIADLDYLQSDLASQGNTGGRYEQPYSDVIEVFDVCFAVIGNITGYKYAPTGAVNLRRDADANVKASQSLHRLPLGTGAVDKTLRGTPGDKGFYARTMANQKRFPGMVPIVAPWGPAAAPHIEPGRPFFEYAVKRCPSADDSVADCCLVIEGDGSIMGAKDGTTTEGGFALAVKSVTTEIPSQITVDDQGEKEYRLRWNALATHTAFSRVIPDIGSLALENPFTTNVPLNARVFGHDYAPRTPSLLGVPDVAAKVSKHIRANINIANDDWGNRNYDFWGQRNNPSGKCLFQRRRGAREREATMFLEHFYVAYGGEDETHQLNKRANLLPINYTRDDFIGPEKTHPPHGFHGMDDKDFPPEYNADGGDDAWSMENPFAIETRFQPNEGNYEKHVRMPTSRQRLWFNGGLHLDSGNTYDDIRQPANSYYGNIPCLECRTEVAGSIEKVIPALLKRYGYQREDSKIYQACSAAFEDANGKLWPYYMTNPNRFDNNPHYTYGVCHADEFRVVVWDYDSTFSARGSVQVGDNPAVKGYRVSRSSNQMARLMRLHTGAPPVDKPEWQLPFTNYRPVRSLFVTNDEKLADDDNKEQHWSKETMCFEGGSGPNPGTEECAKLACGSGSRWCNDETTGTGTDRNAPWATLGISGTSDGTPRTSFWQSVCWVDPFMPAPQNGFPGTVGEPWKHGLHNDIESMYRTFSAGTLWYGDSMTREIPTGFTPGRGGDFRVNGQGNDDTVVFSRSMWNLKTPYSNPFGGTMSLHSFNDYNVVAYPHVWINNAEVNHESVFSDGGSGSFKDVLLHTCADQNNRTFFSSTDFGRRGFMDKDRAPEFAKPKGEAWDTRWSFAKLPQNYPSYDSWKAELRALIDERQSQNVDHGFYYTGPVRDSDYVESDFPIIIPTVTLGQTSQNVIPFQDDSSGPNSIIWNKDWAVPSLFPYGSVNAQMSLFWGATFNKEQFDEIKDSKRGIDPYWITAPVAWGGSTPANPAWAWPGLVMRSDCPTTYTAPDLTNCTHAAWAPPLFGWRIYDANAKKFRPGPIFDKDFTTYSEDPIKRKTGPAWPDWAFEMIWGWHSLSHVGRVDWDAHTLAWKDEATDGDNVATARKTSFFEGYPTGTATDGHPRFETRWTVGPYPLRGKNDGLLECPSSMLEQNFFWHQHIFQHSILKTADICYFDGDLAGRKVDESGLNENGFAVYRDTLSWCVNPELVTQGPCNEGVTDVCGNDNDACTRLYLATCYGAFSNSRTLVDDEAEAHELGPQAAFNTRALCQCDGNLDLGLDGAWAGADGAENYGSVPIMHGNVPGYCLCRSLARTTRVVVGPDSLFETPETYMERPAFLNATDDINFPFCRCRQGVDEPCLIRRICRRGLLGNDNHPLKNLAGDIDEATIAADAGPLRFDPLARMFVSRATPYAKWELDRLETCTGDDSKSSPLCTTDSVFAVGVVGAASEQNGLVVIGYRTEAIALYGNSDCNIGPKDYFHSLYRELFGQCKVAFKFQNHVCVPQVSECDSLGDGFGDNGLFPGLTFSLSNQELAVDSDSYRTALDRTDAGRLAACFQASRTHQNDPDLEDLETLCRGGQRAEKVVVYLPTDLEVPTSPVLRASGICFGVGEITVGTFDAPVQSVSAGQYSHAATFDADSPLCANFRGAFELTGPGYRRSEVCYKSEDQLCSAGLLKSTTRTDSNSCTWKEAVPLKLAVPSDRFSITVQEPVDAEVNVVKSTAGNICKAQKFAFYDAMYVLKTGDESVRLQVGQQSASNPKVLKLDANSVYQFSPVIQGQVEAHNFEVTVLDETSTLQVFACAGTVRDLSDVVEASFLFGECDTRSIFAEGFEPGAPIDIQTIENGQLGRHVGTANVPLSHVDANVLHYVPGMRASQGGTVYEVVPAACRAELGIHTRTHLLDRRGTFEFTAGRCGDAFFCGASGGAWVIPGGALDAVVEDETGNEATVSWKPQGQMSFKECRRLCDTCTAISWTPHDDDADPLVGTCSLLTGQQPTLVRYDADASITPIALTPTFDPDKAALVFCPAAVDVADDQAAASADTALCRPDEVEVPLPEGGVECVRAQCPDGMFSSGSKTLVRRPGLHCDSHQGGVSASAALTPTPSPSFARIVTADQSIEYTISQVAALADIPTLSTATATLARLELYLPWLETPPDGCPTAPANGPWQVYYKVTGTVEVKVKADANVEEVVYTGAYDGEVTLTLERADLEPADALLTGIDEVTIEATLSDLKVQWFDSQAAQYVETAANIYRWPDFDRESVPEYDPAVGCRSYIAIYGGTPMAATLEWCLPSDPTGHGCTAITVCDPLTHYEKTPPAADRDRECVALTTCPADTHFESAAPTPTTDRGCSARKECNLAISFYKDGGSAKSQTVCQVRGECARGQEYHGNTDSALSDTECLTYTVCGDDQYEDAPGTAAADRTCVSVSEECQVGTTFEQAAPTATTDRGCVPVRACVEGETQGEKPTAGSDRVCVPIEPPAPPPEAVEDPLLEEWAAWTFAGGGIAVLAASLYFKVH